MHFASYFSMKYFISTEECVVQFPDFRYNVLLLVSIFHTHKWIFDVLVVWSYGKTMCITFEPFTRAVLQVGQLVAVSSGTSNTITTALPIQCSLGCIERQVVWRGGVPQGSILRPLIAIGCLRQSQRDQVKTSTQTLINDDVDYVSWSYAAALFSLSISHAWMNKGMLCWLHMLFL